MDFLTAIFFIVVVIASIAQKIAQSRSMNKDVDDLPQDTTREIPHGPQSGGRQPTKYPPLEDAIPTAKPKRPSGRALGPPPKSPAEDLFEQLFGERQQKEEADWEPAHQPQRRSELPRQIQPGQREAQRRVERVPTRTAPQQRQRRQRPEQRTTPQRRTQPQRTATPRQPARQPARQPERQAPPPPRRAPTRAKTSVEHILFGDLDDVRRGIVLSQVLGQPKAFDDAPPAPFHDVS